MRESRTYGSVRGARDEARVPTASRALTGLDVEFFDKTCVLFRILLSDASELLRSAADRLGRRLEQALARCGIGERHVDFRVEARDDRGRRSHRHERTVPWLDGKALEASFLQGWHLGQARR